jgi:hypothetical protein
VTPPVSATGPQQFVGSVIVDGIEGEITGDTVINTSRAKLRPTLPPVIRSAYE